MVAQFLNYSRCPHFVLVCILEDLRKEEEEQKKKKNKKKKKQRSSKIQTRFFGVLAGIVCPLDIMSLRTI